jgi:esterase/lipase superfamily enzyme
MDSPSTRRHVHWVSNYEVTEADQPVAPIKGILRTLRSNQWLVLSREFAEHKVEFYPFRKRELVQGFADAEPLSIASEVLRLPERGAMALVKRIWRTDSDVDQTSESTRMVWVDERGMLLGIGVPREAREHQSVIKAYLEISEELTPQTHVLERGALGEGLGEMSEEAREEPEEAKAGAEPFWIVPVFYATDRKRNPQSSAEDIRYTNERATNELVSLGVCSVSIPRIHELGKLERPPKWKIWARLKPSQHMMLLSTTELAGHQFWQRLDTSIGESVKRDVFIFVHGYNVSFEDAALRTAQLARDLSFEGGPVMFSWPSKGKLLSGYLSDEGTIQWSRPHLRKFIEDVCTSCKANSIHLIAHSMGSRALVEVVQALSASSLPVSTLKQLIFAAPDVDSGVFQQAAKVLSAMCTRVTLYASDNDQALKFSKTIHGYARAGEAGTGILLVAGVDTIDASLVDTDFLGHSGFATANPLMQDVYYLLQHGHSPDQRFGLDLQSSASGRYWSFKAGT